MSINTYDYFQGEKEYNSKFKEVEEREISGMKFGVRFKSNDNRRKDYNPNYKCIKPVSFMVAYFI